MTPGKRIFARSYRLVLRSSRDDCGKVRDVLGDQLVDGRFLGADGLRADLLVVADDDRLVRQGERGEAEDVALRAFVHDDHVEPGHRAERLDDAVGRHDPHRHGGLRVGHRLLRLVAPAGSVLSRSLADPAKRVEPGGEPPSFPVGETLGHREPGGLGGEGGGGLGRGLQGRFELALQLAGVIGHDDRRQPGGSLPPLPGAQRAGGQAGCRLVSMGQGDPACPDRGHSRQPGGEAVAAGHLLGQPADPSDLIDDAPPLVPRVTGERLPESFPQGAGLRLDRSVGQMLGPGVQPRGQLLLPHVQCRDP